MTTTHEPAGPLAQGAAQSPQPPPERISLNTHLARAALLLACFTSTWTGVYLGPLKLVDIMLAVTGVLVLPLLSKNYRPLPGWIVLLAGTIAVVAVLNILAPVDSLYMGTRVNIAGLTIAVTESGSSQAVQWIVELIGIPLFAIVAAAGDRRLAARLLHVFALGAAISGLVATSDFLGATSIGQALLKDTEGVVGGRQNGLSDHVNNLGFTCAVAFPFGLSLVRKHRVVGALTLFLCLSGVILSGSRGSQAATVLIIVVTLITVGPVRRSAPVVLLAATGVALVALSSGALDGLVSDLADVLRFGDQAGSDQSNDGRAILLQQGVDDFQHSPVFGIGFTVLTSAHSVYLQLLATGGLLLGAGMIVFWVGALRTCVRVARRGQVVAAYAAVGVATWLFAGAVENALVERYLYFPIAAIAVLHACARHDDALGTVDASSVGARPSE